LTVTTDSPHDPEIDAMFVTQAAVDSVREPRTFAAWFEATKASPAARYHLANLSDRLLRRYRPRRIEVALTRANVYILLGRSDGPRALALRREYPLTEVVDGKEVDKSAEPVPWAVDL
jgi:hypothetical protein